MCAKDDLAVVLGFFQMCVKAIRRRWMLSLAVVFVGGSDHGDRCCTAARRYLAHFIDELEGRHCDDCARAFISGALNRDRDRGQSFRAAADRVDIFNRQTVDGWYCC